MIEYPPIVPSLLSDSAVTLSAGASGLPSSVIALPAWPAQALQASMPACACSGDACSICSAAESVPVPGSQLVAYLRCQPTPAGCRVEVDQQAEDAEQAEFLTFAWSMVLGRFAEYAGRGGIGSGSRPKRPKRRQQDPAP